MRPGFGHWQPFGRNEPKTVATRDQRVNFVCSTTQNTNEQRGRLVVVGTLPASGPPHAPVGRPPVSVRVCHHAGRRRRGAGPRIHRRTPQVTRTLRTVGGSYRGWTDSCSYYTVACQYKYHTIGVIIQTVRLTCFEAGMSLLFFLPTFRLVLTVQ